MQMAKEIRQGGKHWPRFLFPAAAPLPGGLREEINRLFLADEPEMVERLAREAR